LTSKYYTLLNLRITGWPLKPPGTMASKIPPGSDRGYLRGHFSGFIGGHPVYLYYNPIHICQHYDEKKKKDYGFFLFL